MPIENELYIKNNSNIGNDIHLKNRRCTHSVLIMNQVNISTEGFFLAFLKIEIPNVFFTIIHQSFGVFLNQTDRSEKLEIVSVQHKETVSEIHSDVIQINNREKRPRKWTLGNA